MSWTALVPLKAAGARKERLAERLDASARDALAERMFGHVVATLAGCADIASVVVLAPARPAAWAGAWQADTGGGLNAELARAGDALAVRRLLVIHADLPELAVADIAALLAAAEAAGAAIAPDRHMLGTNAIAAVGSRAAFAFGPGSFVRHRLALPHAAIVTRRGLAHDLDTPADLAAMAAVRAA